jgi:L-rhamnose 1-dehydrogenase
MKKDVSELLQQTSQTDKERFITVSGDISKPETGTEFIEKTVQAFGRLDVFVSNAGVCRFEEFLE